MKVYIDKAKLSREKKLLNEIDGMKLSFKKLYKIIELQALLNS